MPNVSASVSAAHLIVLPAVSVPVLCASGMHFEVETAVGVDEYCVVKVSTLPSIYRCKKVLGHMTRYREPTTPAGPAGIALRMSTISGMSPRSGSRREASQRSSSESAGVRETWGRPCYVGPFACTEGHVPLQQGPPAPAASVRPLRIGPGGVNGQETGTFATGSRRLPGDGCARSSHINQRQGMPESAVGRPLMPAIQPFGEAHIGLALDLWRETEHIGLSSADEPRNLRAYLSRNPGCTFVALKEGRLVGACFCGHDGRRGYIHHLTVARSHRRGGLGTRLLARCLDALREAGVRKCHGLRLPRKPVPGAVLGARRVGKARRPARLFHVS